MADIDQIKKFCRVSGAKMNPDERNADIVTLDGKTVKVIPNNQYHNDGFVRIQLVDEAGKAGWCSSKVCTRVAFGFPKGWATFRTSDLGKLVQRCALTEPRNAGGKPMRVNGFEPSSAKYVMMGTPGKKDVYTYITKVDLTTLEFKLYV